MDLKVEFLGNPLSAWLAALGEFLVILLAAVFAKNVVLRRLARYSKRSATALDDAVVYVLDRTKQGSVAALALYAGCRWLTLPPAVDRFLDRALIVILFLQLGIWINALLGFYVERSQKHAEQADAAAATSLSAIAFLARLLIWSAIVLLTLANLGIDVTALVAGLGVGGVAVALAVQNILGDLLASLSIVLDKPFVIGDFVVVDSYMGTIEHVGIKTTRLRSLSGEQLVFSNGDLLKSRLRNYKRMRERRAVFGFGVLYQTPAQTMRRIPGIVKHIVEAQPETRFDRAHFKGFGASSLDFEVVYWVLDPDYNKYMDIQQAINLALMEAMAAEGVGFAYPSTSLYLESPVRIHTVPGAPEGAAGQ